MMQESNMAQIERTIERGKALLTADSREILEKTKAEVTERIAKLSNPLVALAISHISDVLQDVVNTGMAREDELDEVFAISKLVSSVANTLGREADEAEKAQAMQANAASA